MLSLIKFQSATHERPKKEKGLKFCFGNAPKSDQRAKKRKIYVNKDASLIFYLCFSFTVGIVVCMFLSESYSFEHEKNSVWQLSFYCRFLCVKGIKSISSKKEIF